MWHVLHGLAERLGTNSNPFSAAEEYRTWVQLLRASEWIMPCQRCRAHFHQWCLQNPPEQIDASTIRVASRTWLWRLHESVNIERKVKGIPLESVEALYATTDLQKSMTTLLTILKLLIQDDFSPSTIRIWKATADLLFTLVGTTPVKP